VTVASLAGVVEADMLRLLNEIAVAAPPAAALGTPLDCVKELRRQPLRVRLQELNKKIRAGAGDDSTLKEVTDLARRMASL
jgi:hypothetical protein